MILPEISGYVLRLFGLCSAEGQIGLELSYDFVSLD